MQNGSDKAVYQECMDRIEWVKRQFKRFSPDFEDLYHMFLEAFFVVIAIIVALRLAGVGGIAMDYFYVALAVFGLIAILSYIKMKLKPKDTRLDKLIEIIDKLGKPETLK